MCVVLSLFSRSRSLSVSLSGALQCAEITNFFRLCYVSLCVFVCERINLNILLQLATDSSGDHTN